MHTDLYKIYKKYIDDDWLFINTMANTKVKNYLRKVKIFTCSSTWSKGSKQRALGLKINL